MVKKSEKTEQVSTKKKNISKSIKPISLELTKERDIAMDFASKVYKKFDKTIKSVVLFGSSAKKVAKSSSDIDIIIIIDDVSIRWDQELISWYREELGKIISSNPYRKELHITSTKLSTWWQDLLRGDPVVINIIRYGDPLIDFGGFFTPLKVLLQEGKIKPTPESIYTLLQRTPQHIARARASLVSVIDGLYWAMVDSAHAALIAAKIMPPSPEHIPDILYKAFVTRKLIKSKYVDYYVEIHNLAKAIIHRQGIEIKGKKIDELFEKTNDFVQVMTKLIDDITKNQK